MLAGDRLQLSAPLAAALDAAADRHLLFRRSRQGVRYGQRDRGRFAALADYPQYVIAPLLAEVEVADVASARFGDAEAERAEQLKTDQPYPSLGSQSGTVETNADGTTTIRLL
jgi:hypothetical protein